MGTKPVPEPIQPKPIQEEANARDDVSPPLEDVEKFKDEFVIFFSGNMADPTTQKLFFDEYKNVKYLGEGNFPGVAVVKIEHEVKQTLTYLKGKDYIDLIIKNQDGLDCHTN